MTLSSLIVDEMRRQARDRNDHRLVEAARDFMFVKRLAEQMEELDHMGRMQARVLQQMGVRP